MRKSFLRRAIVGRRIVSRIWASRRRSVGFNGCANSATFGYYKRGPATNFNFQIVAKGVNQQTVLNSFIEEFQIRL